MGIKSRLKREQRERERITTMQARNPKTESDVKINTETEIIADNKVAKAALGNIVTRKVVALKSKGAVVAELTSGSTENVVHNLNELSTTGTVSESKIKKALMSKAPGEMDKAIRKFHKEGREISVDSLCAEAESTPSFVKMCEDIGLPMTWFRELAKERINHWRI
jgi:antitoxin component YwqK of YwqJK toxin-antitoxin module